MSDTRLSSLVIFDMDGTLVDSEVVSVAVLSAVLTEHGYAVTPDEVMTRFIGVSIDGIVRQAAEDAARRGLPVTFPEGFAEAMHDVLLERLMREITPVPGIRPVLASLTPDAWCIASNSNATRVRNSLINSGLLPPFDPPIYSAEMVKAGKPAPDVYLYAAAQRGCNPAQALVVEDTTVGVRAGKAAGMTVIGFMGGSHISTPDDHGYSLKAAGADLLAEDADALKALLRERLPERLFLS